MRAHLGPSVTLSAVIIRACDDCGGKRELGRPCESCGSRKPADVKDLGIIASHQKSRWERFKWNLYGCYVAQRRIRKENKRLLRDNMGLWLKFLFMAVKLADVQFL